MEQVQGNMSCSLSEQEVWPTSLAPGDASCNPPPRISTRTMPTSPQDLFMLDRDLFWLQHDSKKPFHTRWQGLSFMCGSKPTLLWIGVGSSPIAQVLGRASLTSNGHSPILLYLPVLNSNGSLSRNSVRTATTSNMQDGLAFSWNFHSYVSLFWLAKMYTQ
eukprot:4843820-Amphidinium_carterae.2